MIPALTEGNLNLFRKLYAHRSWLQKLRGQDQRLDLVRQIEASGQVAAIFSLFHLLDSEDHEFAQAVAGSMYRLFQGLAPQDFPAFDENIRRTSWSSWSPGYTVVRPSREIRALAKFGELSFFLTGVFSCHADGYTREAAIRMLGNCETGEELPFVLLRINDWVENVRIAAAEVLNVRIEEQRIPLFIKFLPLVLRLKRTTRQSHDSTLGRIQGLFALPAALPAVEKGMSSNDGLARRFCYGVALKTSGHERLATVALRALADSNLRIGLDALRAISSAPPSSSLREIVAIAVQSPIPAVRLEALRIVIEKYPESAHTQCSKALLDRNSAVRLQAQFYFQKSGVLNVCDFYVDALSTATTKDLPAIIAGIGECCPKSQVALVKPYVASQRSVVRVRALQSLALLDRDYPLEDFLKALKDESSQVVRVAALFLRKKVNAVGGERLWAIHERLANPRHRRWTLFLLARLTKWDSVYYLIQAMSDQNDDTVELARKYLERWTARYNRSFIVPSKAQIERLKVLLREHELLLSPVKYKQLDSLLKSL